MARILILGAGGVANVIAVKISQHPGTFSSPVSYTHLTLPTIYSV